MKPGPAAVSEIILDSLQLDSPPRNILEAIRQVIGEQGWDIDKMEKAEQWRDQVLQILQRHHEACLAEGRQPRVAFNSSTPWMIQGPCFIEPKESDAAKELKRRRLRWREYHQALRELEPREFEHLCTGILELLQAKESKVTAYRGDEGIDFFGRVTFAEVGGLLSPHPIFEQSLTVWLVGQAKHYKHAKVATPDIRELVGAVTLGKARAFGGRDEEQFAGLNIRVCDPVFMFFFATGQISAHGWRLCKNAGVVAMDGELLAQFLADKGVGVIGPKEDQQFSRANFVDWVRSLDSKRVPHGAR